MNEGGASGEWKSAPSAPKLRAARGGNIESIRAWIKNLHRLCIILATSQQYAYTHFLMVTRVGIPSQWLYMYQLVLLYYAYIRNMHSMHTTLEYILRAITVWILYAYYAYYQLQLQYVYSIIKKCILVEQASTPVLTYDARSSVSRYYAIAIHIPRVQCVSNITLVYYLIQEFPQLYSNSLLYPKVQWAFIISI